LAEIKCGKPWSQIRTILGRMQATEFKAPGHVFSIKLNESQTIPGKLVIIRYHKVFGVKHMEKIGTVT
jgi:hypothetical protein